MNGPLNKLVLKFFLPWFKRPTPPGKLDSPQNQESTLNPERFKYLLLKRVGVVGFYPTHPAPGKAGRSPSRSEQLWQALRSWQWRRRSRKMVTLVFTSRAWKTIHHGTFYKLRSHYSGAGDGVFEIYNKCDERSLGEGVQEIVTRFTFSHNFNGSHKILVHS